MRAAFRDLDLPLEEAQLRVRGGRYPYEPTVLQILIMNRPLGGARLKIPHGER